MDRAKREGRVSAAPDAAATDEEAAASGGRVVQRKVDGFAAQQAQLQPGAQPGFAAQRQALATQPAAVQGKGAGSMVGDAAAIAATATQEGGGPLPHLGAIQRAFGRHDVSGVQFHAGGAAERANQALGSEAFASGDHVATAGTTDLHTMAHEAAHVVQQRGGVQLKGGLGQAGDGYERHADQVADRVVRGESAEALLDTHAGSAGGGAGGDAVQRRMSFKDLGDDYAFIVGTIIRHHFRREAKALSRVDPKADAVIAAVEAPADMPNLIERKMKADEDFGTYDLERFPDLVRLFRMFKAELFWQRFETPGVPQGVLDKLREGSEAAVAKDGLRAAMSPEDQQKEGFALLPILEEWRQNDEGNGRLERYDATEREKVVYRVDRGRLLKDDGSDKPMDTMGKKPNQSEIYQRMTRMAEQRGIDLETVDIPVLMELQEEASAANGSFIYAMNAAGQIFAAAEKLYVVHHSSFLAGGAVASAGTLGAAGGAVKEISNTSGHYKPGPAYLWQAVAQLATHGVDLSSVNITVAGLSKSFASARHFFEAMNPARDPRLFETAYALEHLEQALKGL